MLNPATGEPLGTVAHAGIGDLDRAAEAAAEAERLAPSPSGHVYRRQAEIEGRRNNPAGALQILEQAVRVAPDDPWSWFAMASHRSALNDLDGAEAAAAHADAGLTGAGRAHVLRLRAQLARKRKISCALFVTTHSCLRLWQRWLLDLLSWLRHLSLLEP